MLSAFSTLTLYVADRSPPDLSWSQNGERSLAHSWYIQEQLSKDCSSSSWQFTLGIDKFSQQNETICHHCVCLARPSSQGPADLRHCSVGTHWCPTESWVTRRVLGIKGLVLNWYFCRRRSRKNIRALWLSNCQGSTKLMDNVILEEQGVWNLHQSSISNPNSTWD